MKLTELSARQIRYYEEHELVNPARTEGNRRLYSFNDIDKLLEIKDLIEQGVNLAGIKQLFAVKGYQSEEDEVRVEKEPQEMSDKELRDLLRNELLHSGRYNRTSLRQGELSRFFH